MAKHRNDILQGTLALLVLQTLAVRGALHGYAITAAIEGTSAELLRVEEGSLYPALMRLEQRGLVKGKWGVTENNRKARFYRLTAAGRRQLESEKLDWDRIVSIMDELFEGNV